MPALPRRAVLPAVLALTITADAGAAQRVSVADPGGGARWTATQSSASGGRTCVTIRHGKARRGTSCARLTSRVVYSYDVSTRTAQRPRATRTIFIVALAPNVVRARLQTPGGARTYRRRSGRPRVLLAVLAGRVERPTLTVDVKTGRRTTRVVEGQPPAVQVADPLGGPAWRSRTAAASGGGDVCISWERVPPRFAATPEPARGTPYCGDADADVPVAAAQAVSDRLVVYGLAGAGVRSAVLRTPDGDRTLALEPKTRALLAVLPGGTDPASVRVVARLGDGREVERPVDVVK
jgi:hypothetical protein